MKRAVPWPVICGHTSDAHMTELRVVNADGRLPANDQSNTNSSADCHVSVVSQPLRRAPLPFCECRTHDVSGKAQRYREALAKEAYEVDISPALFGSRLDSAKGCRIAAQIQWAKGGNAQRGEWAVMSPPIRERLGDGPQRGIRVSRR
jgi:hypothetical protein